MEAPDNLEVSKMVADAVRAAVAVQSDALNQMLADDAVAAAEENAAHAGRGCGMDDSSQAGGGATNTPWVYVKGTGWTNACVQIGNTIYYDSDIQDLDMNTAGSHFLTIDLTDNTMGITTSNQSDGGNGIVSLFIGRIDNDGNQTSGIYTMPIVFAWA